MINNEQEYLLFKPANSNPKNASKIFFACHPDDFNIYFDGITNEILEKTADNNISAFFSYINPDITPCFDNIVEFLENMQLIVIPVTWKLLQTPNMTINQLVPYALQKHIPILPLLQDQDSIDEYTKHFGNMQFLCDNKNDKTAIPYEIKLNDFIKDTLVSNELRTRVQAAFDAYIFLSYRKKDRGSAQEIMRLIHENAFCRDIAIWYDEFLVPGEDFNTSIKKAIDKSDLFAMVITPNIVEPDNYVILHEYPMAHSAKKTILPLESIETDKNKLREHYENIPSCTDVHNSVALSEALLRNLNITAKQESSDSPEHNYLIGLAYLTGIDVEINHKRGIELIKKAAEANLPEAIARMITISRTGMGCQINYNECDFWSDRLIAVLKKQYPKYDSNGWLRLMHSLYSKFLLHNSTGNLISAKSAAEEAIFYAKAVQTEKDIYHVCHVLSFSYLTLAGIEQQLVVNNPNETDNSAIIFQKSLIATLPPLRESQKVLENYSKRHPEDNCDALRIFTYSQLLSVYSQLRNLKKAKKYADMLMEIFIAQNNQQLIDELNFQWASFEESLKLNFDDEKSVKGYFYSLIEYLNKKETTKESAPVIFQSGYQLCSLAESLFPHMQIGNDDIQLFSSLIKRCLDSYEMLSKKHITNSILSFKSKILLFATTLENHLGNKEMEYFYWQEYLQILEVILSRYNTIENKKSLQKALYILCWLALSLKKLDEAFEYGKRNHSICDEILKELENDESAYIDCVNHFGFISHYFLYKDNSEQCLKFAKSACNMAASICKMFNDSVNSSFTLANAKSDYGSFLYAYQKNIDAIQNCKFADGLYHTIFNKYKASLSSALKREIFDKLCDNLKLLGDIYFDTQDTGNAEKEYIYFLKLVSNNKEKKDDINYALYRLAEIYISIDNYDKAEEYIEKLISENLNNEQYLKICDILKQRIIEKRNLKNA